MEIPDFIPCYLWPLLTRETGARGRQAGSWRLDHSDLVRPRESFVRFDSPACPRWPWDNWTPCDTRRRPARPTLLVDSEAPSLADAHHPQRFRLSSTCPPTQSYAEQHS